MASVISCKKPERRKMAKVRLQTALFPLYEEVVISSVTKGAVAAWSNSIISTSSEEGRRTKLSPKELRTAYDQVRKRAFAKEAMV